MIGGPWARSMKGVHGPRPYFDGPGPWTRSTEGDHGLGVHVLYFPHFHTTRLGRRPSGPPYLHSVYRGVRYRELALLRSCCAHSVHADEASGE